MQSAETAASSAMDAISTNDVPSSFEYQCWGGLPAAIATTDDFKSAREADPLLARTFDTLDRLMSCQGPKLADIVTEFNAAGFTAHEINRLASPLLDGLWVALTGRPVNGQIHAPLPYEVFVPPNLELVLSRMITRRRCYVESMDWLLQRCSDLRLSTDDAILRAAATGHQQAIELLLRYHSTSRPLHQAPINAACEIAATNGHLAVVQHLLPLSSELRLASICLRGAARNRHVSVVEFLVQVDAPFYGAMQHEAALEGACEQIVQAMRRCMKLTPNTPALSNEEQISTAIKLGRIPLVLKCLVVAHSLMEHRGFGRDNVSHPAVRAAVRFQRFDLLQAMAEQRLGLDLEDLAILLAPHQNAVVLSLLTGHRSERLDAVLARRASSAIIISMIHGHVPMVAAWLQHQQVDARSNFRSLCYIAAAAGSMPLMQLICTHASKSVDSVAPGGDFSAVVRHSADCMIHMDALKAAIRHRHIAVLPILLERVTDPSSRIDAMILALEVADLDTVRLVAMSCADFEAKHFFLSESVLRVARRGNLELLPVLLQCCQSLWMFGHLTGRFLSAVVESNSAPNLELVLTHFREAIRDDLPRVLSCQQTGLALHRAAAMGNSALCTRLIQFMLSTWAEEVVVARLAAVCPSVGVDAPVDFVEIHRILLEHSLVNLEDETAALPFAARYGQLEMCMFLVEHGADVQTDLNAPLKLAHRHKHRAVVEYLLSQGAPACLMEEDLWRTFV